MMKSATAVLALLLLGGSFTWANMPLPRPGYKIVLHELTFDNLDEYPNHRFYLVCEQRLKPFAQGCIKVEPGQKVRPGHEDYVFMHWSVHLFAVPQEVAQKEGDTPKKEWFDGATSGVSKSEEEVVVTASVPASSPVAAIHTRYRIDLKDGVLRLVTTEEQPVNATSVTNWIIPGIALVAAVLAAVLALLSRRKCGT
jgi:hypothetical protein